MKSENLMKSVELEIQFKTVSEEVDSILTKVQAYTTCLELIYDTNEKNKDFIADMQMKQATLLRLVNKLNDIEMQAMTINEQSIVFRCESVKSEVRDTMEYVRNLYM